MQNVMTEARQAVSGGLIGLCVAVAVALLLMAVSGNALSGREHDVASLVRPAAIGGDADWERRLARVDRALVEENASGAIYEWREAYGAALRSRRWEALAAVGDAGARLEAMMGSTGRHRAEARQAYLAALFRARAAGSAEGMRRAAGGFEALGDQEAADLARRMPRG